MKDREVTRRVAFLDELRGLSIILMVVYHFAYDIVVIVGISFPLFFSDPVNLLRDFFAGVFIVISGISCNYSQSNIKRGVKVFVLAMALTVITVLFMPSEAIMFGILHLLGVCMVLYGLGERFIKKSTRPYIAILVLVILFISTLKLNSGYFLSFKLPDFLYNNEFLFPFGFCSISFFSSDYFPLLPWAFLFFAASYFGLYFKRDQMPNFFYRNHIKPLSYVGRHTLIIYLLHQPILFVFIKFILFMVWGQ